MLAPASGEGPPRPDLVAVAGAAMPAPVRAGAVRLARDLVATARPAQWQKNALLFAAFVFSAGAAWSWDEPASWLPLLARATAAFAVFCAAASSAYYLNDVLDVQADRTHPRKRLRPIAAGRVPIPVALATAGVLLAIAMAGAALLGVAFAAVLLAYVALTVAYSLQLKHVVILDVLVIATGFALRALAGAIAIDVPVSPWLYVVTTLGALLLAAVKRRQEVQLAAGDPAQGRRVLRDYSARFLDQMVGVALAATIVAYALYVTSAENLPDDHSMLATLPFVLYGLFRFLLIAEHLPAHNIDELIVRDRPLLACLALFVSTALVVLAAHR